MSYNTGLASGILQCVASGISISSIYDTNLYKDVLINVVASGNLDAFNNELSNYPNGYINFVTCAILSGSIGPTTASGLINNYNIENYNSIDLNTSNINTLSGNAYYDVYGAYILYANDKIPAGFSNIVVSSGLLTLPPFPLKDLEDNTYITSEIIDEGDVTTTNDLPLTTFNFNFNEFHNFDNINNFGIGYPDIAESGCVRMSCSGIASGVYFPGAYDGTNESSTPLYEYTSLSGVIQWKVPKFTTINDIYADYNFTLNYINSSGILSDSIEVKYDQIQLKKIDTNETNKTISTESNDMVYKVIDIEGETGRSRIALGIRDIDLGIVSYQEKGTYISSFFTNENPIYALSMNTNEFVINEGVLKPWDFITYYVQFAGSEDWIQISPKPRTNESRNGQYIPNIIILDTNMLEEDKIADLYNYVKFIKYDKEQYSFKVKIELDTTLSTTKGNWSPMIYDYKVSVIDRMALNAVNFDRYLFN